MRSRSILRTCLAPVLGLLMGPLANAEPPVGAQGSAEYGLPEIPGITAGDPYPRACVDCHVKRPEMDVRLSALVRRWNREGVEPRLLARIKRFVPEHFSLSGTHPPVENAGENIPASCFACHGSDAGDAPPLGPIVHGLHLSGGRENHVLTTFQGRCTYCHKFEPATGRWSLPSASEPAEKKADALGDHEDLVENLRILAESGVFR